MTDEAVDTRPSDDLRLPGGADDVRDPYPMLAAMRRQTPTLLDGSLRPAGSIEGRDFVALYRYDDVVTVLRDAATFPSDIVGVMMQPVMGRTILEMNGEEHHRTRGLVAQAFRPKVLANWEHTLIAPLVDELIDTFASRGTAELVHEFNFLFPARVIARILGLPREDTVRFQKWALAIISYAAHREHGIASSNEVRAYMTPLLQERRDDPGDDLLSELVSAELDGHRLTDDEILPFILLLLPAGIETTYRALGNLLFGLLSHPDQLEEVRADRSLVPAAIEEALRWEAPLLLTARETATECPVGEITLSAGTQIALCQGAANRDDTQWDDPDEFDIHRPAKQHLTFGSGPHMCLGMHLARLEMRIALNALLDRLPNLRLVTDGEDDPHIRGMVFRSPTTLPVAFDPA